MSDTVRDYQKIESAAVDGLDDFFEAEVVAGSAEEYQVAPTDGIPVPEAAKALGLSIKTIKDRLRKGTLEGYKVRDKFGEKWMVSLRRDTQVVPGTTVERDYHVGPPDGLIMLLQGKDRDLQAAAFRNGYLEAQLAERDQQLKLLPDLQARATEAEALKEKIHLLEHELTQLKASRWVRFKKWFLGS